MTRYICNNRDEKFAQIALNEANKSTMLQNHGCVAVMGGRIVARGFNSDRCYSSDGFLNNTCSCHAEIDVMRRLDRIMKKKRLSISERKISLYVVRKNKAFNQIDKENYKYEYKNSAPCLRCSEFMKKLNIKYIIYGNMIGTLTKCRVRDYNTTHITQGTRFINSRM